MHANKILNLKSGNNSINFHIPFPIFEQIHSSWVSKGWQAPFLPCCYPHRSVSDSVSSQKQVCN